MSALLFLLVAYLLGSIPFGLLITRSSGLGDIRKVGSGNIGATNVLRTGNKPLAALTLLLDMGKGAAAVYLMRTQLPGLEAHAALMALLGHMFPVWLKFKGGKGVATFFGSLLVLSWPVAVFSVLTWLVTAFITRISSLSALVSVASAAAFFTIFVGSPAIGVILMMVLLIYIKHSENFSRLIKGTEPKIGQKNKDVAKEP